MTNGETVIEVSDKEEIRANFAMSPMGWAAA